MIISRFMACALLSILQGLAFLQMRFINFPLFFFMDYVPEPIFAVYLLQCVCIISGVWIIDNALKSDDWMIKYGFSLVSLSNMFSSTNKLYEIIKRSNFSYVEFFIISTYSFVFFTILFGLKNIYNEWRVSVHLKGKI